MTAADTSFLGLNGLHAFLTGAAGGIGSETCREFLRNGARVTAFDRRNTDPSKFTDNPEEKSRLHIVKGDLTSESSIQAAFEDAAKHFGPPNILLAVAGITDESTHPPIWEIDAEKWDKVNSTNVRGTFLTIKHFLRGAKAHQDLTKTEMRNLAIVVVGSETGKFGQEGHAEYASGKAGLQYGLVKTVKNEIVRLNSKARINAVAPGWVDTELIGKRLDDPHELWAEVHSTTALRKIAQPGDVARTIAFLSSHRAAGHCSGECISLDGGMEGRLLWREKQATLLAAAPSAAKRASGTIVRPLESSIRKRRLRICLSVDFDAISGYLGTGFTPHNTLSDYSAGIFSGKVGVNRLLSVFRRHGISEKVTWFIPGHSMETFPEATEGIVKSGAEIGLHGYSHEGAYAMTPEQEEEVLRKCIDLATQLTNKRPVGYRAPLYQIRESTVQLLQSNGFLYDTSMNAHDSLPYLLPNPFPSDPPLAPDYQKAAESWMQPTTLPQEVSRHSALAENALVEIPASWYTEDMTPLGFYPYTPNSQGYVSTEVVEKMWWDRFEWLWEHECFVDRGEDPGADGLGEPGFGSIFPLIWHPESAGRAHVIGMIDRFVGKLVERKRFEEMQGGVITFETFEQTARSWLGKRYDAG